MMYADKDDEIARLIQEITRLHEKLLRLRSSRRVLLHLLSTEEQNKQQYIRQLEQENRILRMRLRHSRQNTGDC
ncbi:MAG: translation initiation factor 2 [Sulfobacillus benefaciens]|uniref:Translation initiation factor 2 n=1 Tax=Sulfobacillus benefaciens TaxID=453960 RepID=A0A2T2WW42_9FIRM|nr:MAG: translation initiation factor 2 [Sulfobacillus benefaciens]HBQ95479.1 translation initiation factor 2 [Sulfobacillus sp.]